MLAYDEEGDAQENYENMCATVGGTCVAEITHAVRSTRMNGSSVKEGDIIGISNKKIVAKTTSVEETAIATIKKIAQDKVMVTLYYGEGVSQEEAETLVEKLSAEFEELEIACYFGGQPHYFYIISAE